VRLIRQSLSTSLLEQTAEGNSGRSQAIFDDLYRQSELVTYLLIFHPLHVFEKEHVPKPWRQTVQSSTYPLI
jgi:hypothetical protein